MATKIRAILYIAALLGWASIASASPITFIDSGIGSGSVEGTPFSDATFTITSTGGTDDREFLPDPLSPGIYWIDHLTSTIEINGVGSLTVLSPTRTYLNTAHTIVGYSHDEGGGFGPDLYSGPTSPAFETWDMLSSIGPIAGDNGQLLQWSLQPLSTNAGLLIFGNSTNTVAFQAIVVPEPSNVVLAAIGLIVLAAWGWRRKR